MAIPGEVRWNRLRAKPLIQDLFALASVAVLTFINFRYLHANSATAALVFLVLILGVAARFHLQQAIAASIASVLAYNFFFLPPVGALTIADPQNWIALFAFTITAVTASQLSANARRKTEEARARQQDLQRMFDFSRALILLRDERSLPDEIVFQLSALFRFEMVWFFSRETEQVFRTAGVAGGFNEADLRTVAKTGIAWHAADQSASILPIQLGGAPLGSLGVTRVPSVSGLALEAVSQLIAIAITRAKEQELATLSEATRQNEQLKATLLDAVAHEFKTPLTSVKAAASTVLSSCKVDDVAKEMVTVIDEETDRLTNLVSDAIEIARIGSSPVVLNKETVLVGELVSEAVAEMTPLLEGRTFQVATAAELPPVSVDRKLSLLMIRQILGNACKYSFPSSVITISTLLQSDTFIQVDICNAGLAIPRGEQRRIFEKFYRAPAVRSQVAGTGLGLSISREIVEAQGGSIAVSSGPGELTCFSFTLPVLYQPIAAPLPAGVQQSSR